MRCADWALISFWTVDADTSVFCASSSISSGLSLLFYALIVIYPFYNALLISISPDEVYASTPFLIWPKEITFQNYKQVFTDARLMDGFKVTLLLLFVGTAYQLFFTVITGYALSRQKWLGKNFVMNMIIVTMFFGGGLVPYYILINK